MMVDPTLLVAEGRVARTRGAWLRIPVVLSISVIALWVLVALTVSPGRKLGMPLRR